MRFGPVFFGLSALSLPFYRVLFFKDRALFFRDLARDLLPQKMILIESLRSGDGIPPWNHFALGGTPFWPMSVGSPLNPLNAIFLLFSPSDAPHALSYYLWAHYVLIFLGAYLFVRALFEGSRWIAAGLALSLALSGYSVSAHNLGHVLSASVAVPWFGYFFLRYRSSPNWPNLIPLSFALAWPIFAGDPQFSYMLAGSSVVGILLATSGRFFQRLGRCLTLGAFSMFCAAAQLLPTADAVLRSNRAQPDLAGMLLFSFHPLRLLETVFPLFFGNRHGELPYWGGSLVNFPYKNPFIFSTYIGVAVLLGLLFAPTLFSRVETSRRRKVILLGGTIGGVVSGVIVSLGLFSPLPLYHWLSDFLPLFSLFRYPERFLYWPLFAAWLLGAYSLVNLFQRPELLLRLRTYTLPASGVMATALFWLSIRFRFFSAPEIAADSVRDTLIFLVLGVAVLYGSARWRRFRGVLIAAFLGLHILDLTLHQNRLVWDQTKYMADQARYPLVSMIREDLDRRRGEVDSGAAFRFSSANLNRYRFIQGRMDHSAEATFVSYQNLLPNTAGYFGIEDISGYFSFLPLEKFLFGLRIVEESTAERDFQILHNITGAYYVPERDGDQAAKLKTNRDAQPYVFVPGRVFLEKDGASAVARIRSRHFDSAKDITVTPVDGGEIKQGAAREGFSLLRRDGHEILISFQPRVALKSPYLVLNESYDRDWVAHVDDVDSKIFLANGWSMALRLPDVPKNRKVMIRFEYRNPTIRMGVWMSVLFLFFSFSVLLYFKLGKKSFIV